MLSLRENGTTNIKWRDGEEFHTVKLELELPVLPNSTPIHD